MRIAFVCTDPGVPVYGNKGCSIHVQELVRSLRRHGSSVRLFARRLGGSPSDDLEAVSVSHLRTPRCDDTAERERVLMQANDSLRQALEETGPFDLVYERYALWSYSAMEYARDLGILSVLEVNAPLIGEQASHRGLVDGCAAEDCSWRAMNAANSIVAVSDAVAAYVQRFDVPRAQIDVIPNGVDTEKFSPEVRASHPAPPGVFTIGFVGTLRPWHGVGDLLSAYATFKEHSQGVRLLIVGDGPEKKTVIGTLRELPAHIGGSVELVGSVPHYAVPGLIASMDVGVAPYPDLNEHYFSPLKLFEYMAAGLPIVASRSGQIKKVIEHEVNGLLYSPGCVDALLAAINRVRDDPTLAHTLAINARRDACEQHSWDRRADQILDTAFHSEAVPSAKPA